MALKGIAPNQKEKRIKMLVYGPAGVGKTLSALQFDHAYIIDAEKGTDFYGDTIRKSNSAVLQTNNVDEIKEEIRTLLTTTHPYRVLILDPITQIYNACQEKWSKIFEKYAKTEKEADLQDFGFRFWSRVKSEMKAIDRMLVALDMSVIILSHQKDIYGPGMQKIGIGPDSMKGTEYLFDYVFELKNINEKRMATTIKERAEIGKNKFPAQFEWSYANFLKFYGKDIIEKESVPLQLISKDQLTELNRLIQAMNISETEQAQWLTKADADKLDELTEDQADKLLKFLHKKLDPKGDSNV